MQPGSLHLERIGVGVHNPAGGECARVTTNPTGSPIVAVWFLRHIPHFAGRPGM